MTEGLEQTFCCLVSSTPRLLLFHRLPRSLLTRLGTIKIKCHRKSFINGFISLTCTAFENFWTARSLFSERSPKASTCSGFARFVILFYLLFLKWISQVCSLTDVCFCTTDPQLALFPNRSQALSAICPNYRSHVSTFIALDVDPIGVQPYFAFAETPLRPGFCSYSHVRVVF